MVKGIGNKVKEAIDSLTIAHITFLKEIKYFHPQGKEMPNGCHYQRGGFLNECKINRESFMPSAAHNNLKGQNGGILVFPIDVDSQIVNGIHDYINNLNGTIKDTQNYNLLHRKSLQRKICEASRRNLRQQLFIIRDWWKVKQTIAHICLDAGM